EGIAWTVLMLVGTRSPGGTPLGYALVLAGAYAPAMAAIALTAWKKGGAGIRALLGPILVADVPVRYYAFAIFYMVTVKLAAAMLHRAILGAWPAFETASVALMPFAVAFS